MTTPTITNNDFITRLKQQIDANNQIYKAAYGRAAGLAEALRNMEECAPEPKGDHR